MRRAAVPIAFVATFTLIAPVGVAVTPSPSLLGPIAPAAARPLLRVAEVIPAPETSLEQLATARPGALAARSLTAPARPAPQPPTHTIVSGDSLWGIARQYGVAVESLAEANRLSLNSILRVQKTIVIHPRASTPAPAKPANATAQPSKPSAQPAKATVTPAKLTARPIRPSDVTVTHVVAPGETLWKIASAYGARVEDVMAHNGLQDGDVIRPGQRILITGRLPQPRQTATSRVRPTAPGAEPRLGDAPLRPAQLGPDHPFLWPTRGVITSRFGTRRYRRHHGGIDLAAAHGTPIYATRDGVVEFAGTMGGYGQVVYVYHGSDLVTVYGHASELLVAAGQFIKRGQMIARVGCTGLCTGSHVHFEVRINGVAVNPLQYLR